jgi:uncharacterized membrane protein
MSWLVLLTGFIHDLSIAVYLGGAVAMEFILLPAQRAIPPAQAQIMGEKTSDRFLILVWVSLILILITGIMRLWFRGFLFGASLFSPPLTLDFAYGRTALALFVVWLALMVNGLLITFVFRPRLTGKMAAGVSREQASQNTGGKMAAATWIQNLSRVDLVLAVIAVLLGAALVRGGLF